MNIEIAEVPKLRVSTVNEAPVNEQGEYIVYWMTAQRRCHWNFALQQALWWCQTLQKPLIIFEPLRIAYPWASDRMHQFIIDGMKAQQQDCQAQQITYFPYLETKHGEGKGLLASLCKQACVVIADEYPCFFLPKMIQTASLQVQCRLEKVDSNGLLPLRAFSRFFTTAASFRRQIQKIVLPYFQSEQFPIDHPLGRVTVAKYAKIPANILAKWPVADLQSFDVSCININHQIAATQVGGYQQAEILLEHFLKHKLGRYHTDRNQIDESAASGLSPYLHFGHISTHQILEAALRSCDWNPQKIASKVTGSRAGWWGASDAVEGFIDELITWREVGFNFCFFNLDTYDLYESLPQWAQDTLHLHSSDPREYIYSLEQFATAQTHDPLWNAAQTQLRIEGRMHNYLRMLWGKKVLEWTESPQIALQYLIELNNRYALDGRDPNSYSGIFWCLGRFDRAWGPERPIFGKIRYMSSDSTRRKLKVKGYIQKYGTQDTLF